MAKAVEPLKLHPTSTSYIYKVFEHLQLLWTGIWLHAHTITSAFISPDLGELAVVIGVLSVQTMLLHNGQGCGTFKTTSHIHIIHL
jgi:hypothetical protein